MKKLFSLFIFAILFMIPAVSFAVSGACSSHGGVNCSSASYSGNAICNDGWESSTNFYDTDECRATCYAPVPSNCSNERDYQTLQTEGYRTGAMRYSVEAFQGTLNACRDSITKYQNELSEYQKCRSLQSSQNTYVPPVYNETDSCKSEFGQNAIASLTKSGYCSCKSGYQWSTNRTECVLVPQKSFEQLCKEKYPNSIWSGTYTASNEVNIPNCECGTGYIWNTNKTACNTITKDLNTNVIPPAQTPKAPTAPAIMPKIVPVKTEVQKIKIEKPKPLEKEVFSQIEKQSTTTAIKANSSTTNLTPKVVKKETVFTRIWKKFFNWF